MGNIGACVRVAAAAGAAAMLSTGEHDPWHPDAVRGAAGLQFALPVASIEALPASERPLLAIDPEGEELAPERLPARAVLAFGTEREGLTSELLGAPMPGSRSRCGRASPASTWRPRWRSRYSPGNCVCRGTPIADSFG